jgi:hypothetical protein
VLVLDREAFVVFMNACPVASTQVCREAEVRRRT